MLRLQVSACEKAEKQYRGCAVFVYCVALTKTQAQQGSEAMQKSTTGYNKGCMVQ